MQSQWVLLVGLGGVIQGAAWDGIKMAATLLTRLMLRARAEGDRVSISPGGTALLALAEMDDLDELGGGILVEAVEEPTSIAGFESPKMGYNDIEPWIVLLIDFKHDIRYIVVVSADGENPRKDEDSFAAVRS